MTQKKNILIKARVNDLTLRAEGRLTEKFTPPLRASLDSRRVSIVYGFEPPFQQPHPQRISYVRRTQPAFMISALCPNHA